MAIGGGVEDRVVSAMKQLGFTATDAKAYVALLKGHPATGYELAARSGVPRSAIYNVLRRLETLGLINPVQAKPAKFMPLPPERLTELVEARFSRNVDELRASLEGLAQPSLETATWTVLGYSQLLEQAQGLIAAATSSVHLSAWSREAARLSGPLNRAVDSGVQVAIFSFTPLAGLPGQLFSYGIAEAELERYWAHKLIVIVDHDRAVIGSADETDDNRAVVTREKVLVEMAISNLVLDITLFGQRRGIDTTAVVTGLTAHLAPVEELVAGGR